MSDYMFMLESHLTGAQRRIVNLALAAATKCSVNLYLSGGAVRDMLGGFPIREVEFTVEGNAMKFAQVLAKSGEARTVRTDDSKRVATLRFPGGAQCRVSLARVEEIASPGGKPRVHPSTIYEHLRGRDFTINALALSLNPASRGLLIDPTNGLADLQRREIRAINNYVFHNDPVRLVRLIRLRTQLGFTVDDRTWQHYQNAREAGLEQSIAPRSLYDELCLIAADPNAPAILEALAQEGLVSLFAPAFANRQKLNLPGLQKLQKAVALIPFGAPVELDEAALFLCVLAERLTPKEQSAWIAALKMSKEECEPWRSLPGRAKRLERSLSSPKLQKPSAAYAALSACAGEELLYLYTHSDKRIIHDRIKNYFQKYLVTAMEVTDAEVTAHTGVAFDAAGFEKAREAYVAARLDGKIRKKEAPVEPEAEPAAPPKRGRFTRTAKAV